MDNYQFYEILNSNTNLYIGLLLISALAHYLIFKSFISTFLDPYFLGILSSVFAAAVVSLLFVTQSISTYTYTSYLLTQTFFWIGIRSFKSLKEYKTLLVNDYEIRNIKQPSFEKNIAFYFFSFVFIVSQISIYVLKGIPLFMVSRLETFANGGGEGILGRFTDVSSIFVLYYFFDLIDPSRFRFKDLPKWLVIGFLFISFLLSGSKSSFLIMMIVFWSYMVYARINGVNYTFYLNLFKAHYKKVVIACLILVSGIIVTQTQDTLETGIEVNPLYSLLLRFIHSGDVYWYSYPNDIYQMIDNRPGFEALFTDALGFLRIYKYEDLPDAIGITLKNIHHPSDIVSGPNARHNVFGLVYYGFWGSIIFSYFLGTIISFTRNVLPKFLKYSTLNGFIFTYIVMKFTSFEADPMLALTYVNNILFVFPFLYLINMILTEIFVGISIKIVGANTDII